jgi:uncharacterized protein
MIEPGGNNRPKFIVDENAGKLVKLLRLLGFDAIFFNKGKDSQLVDIALSEGRILLTRDTHVPERRPVISGRVQTILIKSDNIEDQIKQVTAELNLTDWTRSFTLCLEDNQPLETRTKDEVKERVPPYVFQTQKEYRECPKCRRIYWKGTHWAAMSGRLEKIRRLQI